MCGGVGYFTIGLENAHGGRQQTHGRKPLTESMIRSLFRRLRGSDRPIDRMLEAAFDNDAMCCDRCGTLSELEGLPPLSFVKCPECDATLFVPLRLTGFLLVEPIGAGGMASVYRAYHREHRGSVFAVKLMMDTHRDDAEAVRAFELEAETHRSIEAHPNIAGFVESGTADGFPYYAMEYVKGVRLVQRLEQDGKLPEQLALGVLEQVLSALIHILNHGFLYRDINAANVMLQEDGHAVLLDFGLTLPVEEAAHATDNLTHVDGTPEFLPPERLYGQGEDERSVIYSLGNLTYYMLTAEFLFKAQSIKSLAMKHVSSLRLASAPSLPADISDPTLELVEQMIQQDRDQRLASFQVALEVTRTVLDRIP